jgi:hypothetical protein
VRVCGPMCVGLFVKYEPTSYLGDDVQSLARRPGKVNFLQVLEARIARFAMFLLLLILTYLGYHFGTQTHPSLVANLYMCLKLCICLLILTAYIMYSMYAL